MRTVQCLALACLIGSAMPAFCQTPAPTDAPKKITMNQAMQVLTALRGLDAHPVIIKKDGAATETVMMPWEFGSATLRLKIANDISILTAVERSINDARASVVKELLKGKPASSEIKPGSPEMDEFLRQMNELGEQPAPGTQDLARIKAADLRLDKNEIPSTMLSSLAPIMDQ